MLVPGSLVSWVCWEEDNFSGAVKVDGALDED